MEITTFCPFSFSKGVAYDFIGIDEFSYRGEFGFPQLPSRALSLITSENPNMDIEILSADIDTLKGRNLYPTQAPHVAVTGEEIVYPFQRDEKAYATNALYPTSPLEYGSTFTVRGVPVSQLSVTPAQYNAVAGDLLIYKNSQGERFSAKHYDIKGRLIRDFAEQALTSNQVVLQLSHSGKELATGEYLLSITLDGNSITKKIRFIQ